MENNHKYNLNGCYKCQELDICYCVDDWIYGYSLMCLNCVGRFGNGNEKLVDVYCVKCENIVKYCASHIS